MKCICGREIGVVNDKQQGGYKKAKIYFTFLYPLGPFNCDSYELLGHIFVQKDTLYIAHSLHNFPHPYYEKMSECVEA